MKAIIVTCPHCGARLHVQGTAVQAVCEYCGAASRLQRRTGVLERVMPPPDAPNLPTSLAVERRTLALPILFAVGALVVTGAVMGISAWGPRSTQQPAPPAYKAPMIAVSAAADASTGPLAPSWEAGGPPLLADIDADGTVEILGRARQGDDVVLLAIDQQGKRRWTSEPLGTYESMYNTPLALGSDMLVFSNTHGEVRAFSITDGKQRWIARLDERTEMFCNGGPILIAVGADHVRRGLQVSDGASAPLPTERKPTCARLATDRPPNAPNSATSALAEKHGVNGFEHTVHDVDGGGRVIAGKRSKGTGVPTLVALDASGAERWRADVPVDPLGASPGPPSQVAIGDDVVCATYLVESSSGPLDLTCFGLAEGSRRWTQRLSDHYAAALIPIGGTLLIAMWGNLEARDLQTGAALWQYTQR